MSYDVSTGALEFMLCECLYVAGGLVCVCMSSRLLQWFQYPVMSSLPNHALCDSDEFMPFPYGCLLSSSWSSLKALPKVPPIVPPHHTAMFVRLCCSYVRGRTLTFGKHAAVINHRMLAGCESFNTCVTHHIRVLMRTRRSAEIPEAELN